MKRVCWPSRRGSLIRLTILIVAMAGLAQTAQAGTSGTWQDSTTGGLWSGIGNWSGGVVADGTDAIADFSALNITSDNTVHLDSARTIGNLIFGDTTPSNNWTVDNSGNSANTLTLAVSTGTPTITVNNQTATITAGLISTQGLAIDGPGTLILAGNAIVGGPISVNSGSLQIAVNGASTGGTFNTAAGATLAFVAGNYTLDAASPINNAGTLSVSSALIVDAATINNSGAITLNGSLVTNVDRSLGGTINLGSGGYLGGNGVLTLPGTINWSGGEFTGSGATVIAPGATVTMSGSNSFYISGHTINNHGRIAMLGNSPTLFGYSQSNLATINNQSDGVFDIGNGSFSYSSGSGGHTFNNAGVFRKSVGAGTSVVQAWVFNNNAGGLVDVESGTLSFNNGGVLNNDGASTGGTFGTSLGATLDFGGSGSYTFDAATTVNNAGTLSISGGTLTLDAATISNTGAITLSGGTLNTNVSRSLGGTLNFNSGAQSGTGVLTIPGTWNWSGTSILGTVTASGASDTWTGGQISPGGTVNITATGGLAISGSGNKFIFGAAVNNAGTVVFTGSGPISSGNGGGTNSFINNQAGGLFNLQNDASISYFSGPVGTINNAGTFRKTVATGTSNVSWTFNNNSGGLVDVQTGTIALLGGGASTGGSFQTAAGATLNFGNSYAFDAATTVNNAGTLTLSGGTLTLDAAAITNTGAITLGGSSPILNTNVSRSLPGTINFSSGNQSGTGVLTIPGIWNWSGTSILGTVTASGANDSWTGGGVSAGGTVNIASTAVVTISGSNGTFVVGGTLNNAGTIVWTGTGGISSFNGNGSTSFINNQAGGLFNLQNNSSISYTGGSGGTINNSGTFRKTVAAGNSDIVWTFNNNAGGVVDVQTGTVSFDRAGTSTGGTFQTEAAGTLNFLGYTFDAATTVNNAGTLTLTGGTLTLDAAAITNSGTISVGSGTVEFDSAVTMSNNSILQVNGGTMRFKVNSGSATVGTGVMATVASGAILELAGSVSALSGALPIDRVNVTNNSKATGGGLLVSGTSQQVGNIDGAGNTQVNAGAQLTANHIRQSALVIGGTAGSHAVVTIDASDSSGNPLDAARGGPLGEAASPSGFILAGSLTASEPFGSGGISSANSISSVGGSDSGLLSSGDPAATSNSSAVPEPSSLVVLLLGVGSIVALRFAQARYPFLAEAIMESRWNVMVPGFGALALWATVGLTGAHAAEAPRAGDDPAPVRATRVELADDYADLLTKLADTAKAIGSDPPATTAKSFGADLNSLDQKFGQAPRVPKTGDAAPALTTVFDRRAIPTDRLDEISEALAAGLAHIDVRLRALKNDEQNAIDKYGKDVNGVVQDRQRAVSQAQSLASGQSKVVAKVTLRGQTGDINLIRDATPQEADRFVDGLKVRATQGIPPPAGVAAIRDTEKQLKALRKLVNDEWNHLKVAKAYQKKAK